MTNYIYICPRIKIFAMLYTKEEMQEMLSKYGTVRVKEIDYVTFRGCRNLKDRNKHTIEYIFTVKKY